MLDARRLQIAMRALDLVERIAMLGESKDPESPENSEVPRPKEPEREDEQFISEKTEDKLTQALNSFLSEQQATEPPITDLLLDDELGGADGP